MTVIRHRFPCAAEDVRGTLAAIASLSTWYEVRVLGLGRARRRPVLFVRHAPLDTRVRTTSGLMYGPNTRTRCARPGCGHENWDHDDAGCSFPGCACIAFVPWPGTTKAGA